jgi:hypothetical protein
MRNLLSIEESYMWSCEASDLCWPMMGPFADAYLNRPEAAETIFAIWPLREGRSLSGA